MTVRLARRIPPLLLLLGWIPLLSGATMTGRKAGESYVEFAKLLAREDTPMTDDLARWLGGAVDSECKPEKEKGGSFTRVQKKLVSTFASKVCKPYLALWEQAAAPCDKESAPEWCNDENAASEHVDLDGYYAALTDGIRDSQSAIERDALMFGVVGTLSTHVITEFPNDQVVKWASESLTAYSREASPEGVLRFAGQMRQAWIPRSPQLAGILHEYARSHRPLSPEQVDQINSVAQDLEAR